MLATGAYQAMLMAPPDYYESLLQFSQSLPQTYPSQNLHQIRLDLPRTFADEPYFNQSTAIGKEVMQ